MGTMKVSFDAIYKPWLCVAHKDRQVREAVKCVFLDPEGLLVATDTAVLTVVPVTVENQPADFKGLLIDAEFLKTVHRNKNRYQQSCEFEIDFDQGRLLTSTQSGAVSYNLPTQESPFPRWRECIPTEMFQENGNAVSGIPLCPKQLTSLCQAIGLDADKGVEVLDFGTSKPFLILGYTGAFSLFMPWRETQKPMDSITEVERIMAQYGTKREPALAEGNHNA